MVIVILYIKYTFEFTIPIMHNVLNLVINKTKIKSK